MITQDRALETLVRFNIDEEQLREWEAELALEIPKDDFGNKIYSPLHINLFKNIKKHLALGRSLTEIKRMVILPAKSESQPVEDTTVIRPILQEEPQMPLVMPEDMPVKRPQLALVEERYVAEAQQQEIQTAPFKNTLSQRLMKELHEAGPVTPVPTTQTETLSPMHLEAVVPESVSETLRTGHTRRSLKRFATTPVRITSSSLAGQQGSNAGLLILVDRLMAEKDDLQTKLVEMEKQKVHLYQANDMFQRKVKELNEAIDHLQEKLQSRESFKLIDDKNKLQKQVIEAEQRQAEAEKKLSKLGSEVEQLRNSLASRINPRMFVGNWLEEAELVDVVYDNFGINIESKRNRMFRVTHPPERYYGHSAVIDTTYDYQTNTLWKRTESMTLTLINENRLEGELTAEYILDGTPVAKAIYRVKCHRNGVRTD